MEEKVSESCDNSVISQAIKCHHAALGVLPAALLHFCPSEFIKYFISLSLLLNLIFSNHLCAKRFW
jgi:hypothetical protein